MEPRNFEEFLKLFMCAMFIYYYEGMDPNLKPKDVPQKDVMETYDFIIVGAGAAGCVVAHRLTEVKEWSVLLMEAGGDETVLSDIPLFWTDVHHTDMDWNFTSVPQKHACRSTNGICELNRGRAMGGSSTINSMNYVRGNRKDFDEWEQLGNVGWNYKEALRYFRKSETAKEENLARSPYHGNSGPMYVQYSRYSSEALRKNYIKAGIELGWKHTDYNGAVQENSISRMQMTLDGPSRQSASKAFLNIIRNRKNLAVIKRSYCLRVLIKDNTAIGVEYVRKGRKYTVKARREVILSAGSINSPKILMLSGIGPKAELQNLGIPVISNLPVGTKLLDHVDIILYFKIKENVTITTDVWMTNKTIIEYAKYRRGPLTTDDSEVVCFTNPDNPQAAPSISYIFSSSAVFLSKEQYKQLACAYITLIAPKSVGSLKLRSNDPYDNPLIDPNFLAVNQDYATLYKGIEIALDFMNTTPMKKYSPTLYTEDQPKCSGLSRKEYIHCLIKEYSHSFFHQVGTVKMGPADDPEAVVDATLTVRGFSNLRVVDASIMPTIPRGHLRAPTTMIAEKASDMIKMKYQL